MYHPEELIDDRELSRRVGISVQGLSLRRFRGTGPKYVKLGKSVRYYWRDCVEWIDSQRVDPSAKRAAKGGK